MRVKERERDTPCSLPNTEATTDRLAYSITGDAGPTQAPSTRLDPGPVKPQQGSPRAEEKLSAHLGTVRVLSFPA